MEDQAKRLREVMKRIEPGAKNTLEKELPSYKEETQDSAFKGNRFEQPAMNQRATSFDNRLNFNEPIRSANFATTTNMRIITITSGKGGVGKTNFAVNFACALSKLGQRVTIMDADFGLSNVDLLLGVKSKHNILDVVSKEKTLREVLTNATDGVRCISGGSGLFDLINLDSTKLQGVIEQLGELEKDTDILIIDTGAGVNTNILNLIKASDETILVLNPEPTSIMDAFAITKAIIKQDKNTDLRLVVNKCESINEGNSTLDNFINIVNKYYGIVLKGLGSIVRSGYVVDAIKAQKPFYVKSPNCDSSKNIEQITCKYLNIPPVKKSGGIKGFFFKLIGKGA